MRERHQQPRDEKLNCNTKVNLIIGLKICHQRHYEACHSAIDAAMHQKRQGIHVLVQASDAQRFFHLRLAVEHHLVDNDDAGLLEGELGE